jgi:hypothetical protein
MSLSWCKDIYFARIELLSGESINDSKLFKSIVVFMFSMIRGWSRWLRALLTESPHEDIVSLDFLDPEAFSAVLKYMYGKPMAFNIEVPYVQC